MKRAPSNCDPTDAGAIISAAQDATQITIKQLQSVSGEIASIGPDISKLVASITQDCPDIVDDLTGCVTGLTGDIAGLGSELKPIASDLGKFAEAFVEGWQQALADNDVQCIASAAIALPNDILGGIRNITEEILGGIFGGGGNSTLQNADGLLKTSDIFTTVSQQASGSDAKDKFSKLSRTLSDTDNSTATILDTLSQMITPFSSNENSDSSQLNNISDFASDYKDKLSDAATKLQHA